MRMIVEALPRRAALSAAAFALLALCLSLPAGVRAQWSSGSGRTTTPDTIGVGTAAPAGKLEVRQIGNTGLYATILTSFGANEDTFVRGGSSAAVVHIGDLATTTSKLLLMENGGNVGIGGTNPSLKLQVNGTGSYNAGGAAALGLFNTAATAQILWESHATDNGGLQIADATGGLTKLLLNRGSGAILMLNSNVGIGTTSPLNGLHVHNDWTPQGVRVSGRGGGVVNFVDTAAGANAKLYQWRSEGGLFRLGLLNDAENAFVRQEILVANSAGNVGVGTATPDQKLGVRGMFGLYPQPVVQPSARGMFMYHDGARGDIYAYNYPAGSADPIRVLASSITLGTFGDGAAVPRLTVTDSAVSAATDLSVTGRVLIGTTTPDPAYKLVVVGDAMVTGAISASYQDVAEWVPTTQKLPAGTVVVLDVGRVNHVIASGRSYDTGVAGVVSNSPGVILGEAGEGKVKVATAGRVRVKVDATRVPIQVGDLLVTGEGEGVAMKSIPVHLGDTQIHRPGTIIGKALEPLERGTGEILVLLSLQ